MISAPKRMQSLILAVSKIVHVAAQVLQFLFRPIQSVPLQILLTFFSVVFAFAFNWVAGSRGIFLYDYSIVFDGAWKVLQGQIPYRDFAMSHAPIAYFLLAAAFKLFGVSYGTFIGFASVLNAIGVFASIRIARRLAPGTEFLVGLVTAVWYLPIMGFPQIEHVAFCLNFLCLWFLVECGESLSLGASVLRFLTGALLFCSFMTKQNAGVLFAPILIAYLLVLGFPSLKAKLLSTSIFILGFAFAGILFCAWLWTYGDPALLKHHVFDVPAKFGGQRIARVLSPAQFAYKFVLGITPLSSVQVLNVFSYLVVLLALVKFSLRSYVIKGLQASRSMLVIGLLAFHYLFCASMLNQPESGMPFLGLVAGLTIALFQETIQSLELRFSDPEAGSSNLALPSNHPLVLLPFFIMFLLLFVQGAKIAWQRTANEFTTTATFVEPTNIPSLKPLLWANPTDLSGGTLAPLSLANFEDLYKFLESRNQNFFIFPISTIFYGLLNKPSPAPWLFFMEGHSFATKDLPRLDEMALANFQRLPVCLWIQESHAYVGGPKDLQNLPKTYNWLNQNFKKVQQFGPYEVLENTSCPK